MLDHLSFSVSDYAESVAFYDATLKILGFGRLMTFETQEHQVAGYGAAGKPFFWIGKETSVASSEQIGKARGFHVAFRAPHVDAIKAWYAKCLELEAVKITGLRVLDLNTIPVITLLLLSILMGGGSKLYFMIIESKYV